jgi:hypothetical protein
VELYFSPYGLIICSSKSAPWRAWHLQSLHLFVQN